MRRFNYGQVLVAAPFRLADVPRDLAILSEVDQIIRLQRLERGGRPSFDEMIAVYAPSRECSVTWVDSNDDETFVSSNPPQPT